MFRLLLFRASKLEAAGRKNNKLELNPKSPLKFEIVFLVRGLVGPA